MKDKERAVYEAVGRLAFSGIAASDLTVSAIAREAGVGKGTVYEYFETKEELIANAMCYTIAVEAQRVLGAMESCSGLDAKLLLLLERIDQVGQAHRFLADAFSMIGAALALPGPKCGLATLVLPVLEKVLASIADAAREEGILAAGVPDALALHALGQIIAGHAVIAHVPELAANEAPGGRARMTIGIIRSALAMFGE